MSRFALVLVLLALFTGSPAVSLTSELSHPVQPGDRLDISNFAGSLSIIARDEAQVRIVAEHRPGEEIRLSRRGSVVRVRSASWDQASDSLEILGGDRAIIRSDGAPPPAVVYTVSVPSWLPITAGGALSDITVEGLAAPVGITAFQGHLRTRRLRGDLSVRALAGTLSIADATGTIKIRNWQGDAVLSGTRGNLTVEAASGSISITDHAGGGVEAVTVAGDIAYAGALPVDGRTSLATHSGDLTLTLPADTSAVVSVRTLSGRFESEFALSAGREKSFRFQIGSGRDLLDLESFSGRIRIGRQ